MQARQFQTLIIKRVIQQNGHNSTDQNEEVDVGDLVVEVVVDEEGEVGDDRKGEVEEEEEGYLKIMIFYKILNHL